MRSNAEVAVQEQAKDGVGAEMPACPTQRRVAIRVLGVRLCTGFEQHGDGLFIAESGGAVQRGFAACADVAHEAAGLHTRFGGAVGIGAVGKKHTHDAIVRDALGGAERGVQRRLACVWIGVIGVGALLQQELREPPVTMEAGSVEAEVAAERTDRCAVCQQMADGADVAIIGAVLDE